MRTQLFGDFTIYLPEADGDFDKIKNPRRELFAYGFRAVLIAREYLCTKFALKK